MPGNGGAVFPGTFLEHFWIKKNYFLAEFLPFSKLSYIVLYCSCTVHSLFKQKFFYFN